MIDVKKTGQNSDGESANANTQIDFLTVSDALSARPDNFLLYVVCV